MENPIPCSRGSPGLSPPVVKQTRSGYEPSDTETEWQETPWHQRSKKGSDLGSGVPKMSSVETRDPSPLRLSRRHPSKFDEVLPPARRHSKSPYQSRRDDGNAQTLVPGPLPLPPGRNISPFSKSERRRHVSPFKPMREIGVSENNEAAGSCNKQVPGRSNNESYRMNERLTYNRSMSAPRVRARDKEQQIKYDHRVQKGEERNRRPSPLLRSITPRKDREGTNKNVPSVGEINEMVANAKMAKIPTGHAPVFDSTDSIPGGDIFFSRDSAAVPMQKIVFPKNGSLGNWLSPKTKPFTEKRPGPLQRYKANVISNYNTTGNSSSTVLTGVNSSSAVSRQSSNLSDASGRSTGSSWKFTVNRRKSQTDAWFSCIKKGSCAASNRSPERARAFDEASFIEKAFVVESIRQFWPDKYQPSSLNGFTCHKQQAHELKQLASQEIFPHILLQGPPGSGRKALTMALLREIYGDAARNISHELRYFQIQETRLTQVVVPLTSSSHHVELNVHLEANARYALMGLVKQISSDHAVAPDISTIDFKPDYTVMVLYDVDKADESTQHLIKWIMDCYSDVCKLVLCCEDDVEILEAVKTRCKVIKVDAPITHEIMEVLIHIARKENFELSMKFAAKIANKSKQNLRKAIMALEACKSHNYPFVEDQPIAIGWEDVLIELSAEILADPSNKRLFLIRGKLQKLLLEFVHPKLILLKLIEQFLKGVEATIKREIYYWHGYYDKRLPDGAGALLKLEEFVAKFMSIHRKSLHERQL